MVSFIKIGRMTDYMKIVSNKKMMTNVMNIKSGHVFCFRETYYMKLSDIGENCAVNLLDGKCSSNDFNYILSEAMESVEGDVEFMEGVIQECKDVLKGYHKKYGDKSKKIRVITNESDSFSVLRYGDDFDICGHGLSNWDWIMLLNNLGYEVERIVASDDELDRIL